MEKRLAAILAADIVGYSRLMAADQEGTLQQLRILRDTLFEPRVRTGGGSVVKRLGDGWIVEFPAISDAVSCAISIQEGLVDIGTMQLRMGIHVGEVVFEAQDVFGDGVNIAARLEALAEPGQLVISDSAHNGLDGKQAAAFRAGGTQTLKNIARPVGVWCWSTNARLSSSEFTPADRLSLAVMPFENLSGDPEQGYFANGISEDIMTGLARFRTLSVVAQEASTAFHSRSVDARQIGQRLSVGYLVRGSVRQAGGRVRISAQLVETETGNQIWAERYDRDFDDSFAVQDEVTQSIVSVLPGRVQSDVADRAGRKPASKMRAYELLLKGKALRDGLNAQDTAKARQYYEKALELDPGYARAYMYLADTYVVDGWLGLGGADAAQKSLEIARKGAGLDNRDVFIQDQLGYAFLSSGMWEDADAQFEKTLSLIVSEAESMAWCGYGFLLLGRHDRAQEVIAEALRLDPLHPPALDWILGQVHFAHRRYEDVIHVLMGEALLNSLAHAFLVAAYAYAGRLDEAEQALQRFITYRREELLSRGIKVSDDNIATLLQGYRGMWRVHEDWVHLVDGLRRAGLPES